MSHAQFADLHPPLSAGAALAEANRCLYCFDAPCATACPTHIDVPGFIRKITGGNAIGAAHRILDANILGGSCARACPVEVLCEGSCVLHHAGDAPIKIGLLQRHTVDAFYDCGSALPFTSATETGLRVALIGAGPASLACAAELRRRGIAATIYDARPLPGGLNTYGIAEYKLPMQESLREIEMLRQLGVQMHFNMQVGAAQLKALEESHDAVFLGLGLGGIHKLGIGGEQLAGVLDALDLIAGYKAGNITRVDGRVAVIGAGNTAIDAAIAAHRLGATSVHMVYRRGAESMSAFASEYEHAMSEGIHFLFHVQPVSIDGTDRVQALRLISLEAHADGSMVPLSGTETALPVDHVVLAIGQATHTAFLDEILLERGRVVIHRPTGQTSHPRYFAGGDCTNGGREVVDAVADGKRAAIGIAAYLEGRHANA